MNCKDIKEVMLADYLDNETDSERKRHIEEHLDSCPACKKFYMEVKKAAYEPFLDADRTNPPEYLWRRIKETILAEEEKKPSLAANLLGKLRALLYMPRPALAIASIIVLILAVGTIAKVRIGSQEAMRAGIQEQLDYFEYLTGSSGDLSANGSTGFGTPVETYFM